jgi:hypothetical protein
MITVTAVQAGAEVRCLCGEVNAVPSLSELRHSVGQPRYNLGIVERIRQKVATGDLPSESACVKCGVQTSGILFCDVECERPWRSGGGFWKYFFLFLLAPVWLWFGQALKDSRRPEQFGRETVVEVPLRMCPECQSAVRTSDSAWELESLLQKVPLCHELLCEYPEATITVSSKQA